jgi:hypothetical protein
VGLCGTTLRSFFRGSGSQYDAGTVDSGWHHIAAVFDGVGDVVGGHGGTVGGSGVFPFTFAVILNCGAGSPTAPCLNDRFLVSVNWRTPDGATGHGTAVGCTSSDSAIFWFFEPTNWELLVKSHNACVDPFNRYWLFSAAATNVFYRLQVYDVRAGASKVYFNYPGPPALAVTDTDAFATCP